MATSGVIPTNANADTYSGFFHLMAWIITIIIILLIAKTKIGYTLLFYFFVGSTIIVFAIGAPTITRLFGLLMPQTPLTVGGNRPTI